MSVSWSDQRWVLIISVSSPPYSINILYSGLIISGGISSSAVSLVEVFVPSTGQHCTLPDLPAGRYIHTMEEMVVCGGGQYSGTRTSCLTLTDDGWETTNNSSDNVGHGGLWQ